MPFDRQRADRALNFFERCLHLTKDEHYGKPFSLARWQEADIGELFGRVTAARRMQYKRIYWEIPKKSGKSETAAGILLYVLSTAEYPGCEVYGAASAQKQAEIIYRAACSMVEQEPMLKRRLRIGRSVNRIYRRDDPSSFYAAVAADGDMGDGVNPRAVVADEVHRWRTRKMLENWDVLSLGGLARAESFILAITTAGVESESPLAWRLHQKARQIIDGAIVDPTFFARIYGASHEDDWTDEKTWIKASPSLKENGGFLDIQKLREEFEACKTDPVEQIKFRRYYLNLWDKAERRAVDMADWSRCAATFRAHGLCPQLPEDKCRQIAPDLMKHFIERPCYAGVDLSLTTDLSAIVLAFPVLEGEAAGTVELLPFFYLPENGLQRREHVDMVPYTAWAAEGFLETCPGAAIDYSMIEERLEWVYRCFDLRHIVFDPYNSREISTRLIDRGLPCSELVQTFPRLTEPTKKFLELISTRKLSHGDHPILRWNAACLSLRDNGSELVMPAKPNRSTDNVRIDGISATVNALAYMIGDPYLERSCYEDRGIEMF